MDFKKIKAPTSTITYNREVIENKTDNIYKAISIIAKRTVQINEDIKKELISKLEEFATPVKAWKKYLKTENKLKFPNSTNECLSQRPQQRRSFSTVR